MQMCLRGLDPFRLLTRQNEQEYPSKYTGSGVIEGVSVKEEASRLEGRDARVDRGSWVPTGGEEVA